MRSIRSVTIAVLAIVIFGGGLTRCAYGQGGVPPPPASADMRQVDDLLAAHKTADALAMLDTIHEQNHQMNPQLAAQAKFRKAELLAKDGKPKDAVTEYAGVAREFHGIIPEIASDALRRGSELAAKGYGPSQDDQKAGEDAAWLMLKQLRDEYHKTDAYGKVTAPTAERPTGLLQDVMDRIDRRNAKDWKYQVIDSFVKATGKNPAYSYGLALIFLAILVKGITLPLTRKQYASMREMQRMQPLVKELQKKFKGADLQQKTMALYKEHNVNPLAGCWPSLVQLPFLIGVFTAVREYEIAFSHGHFLWVGSAASAHAPEWMGQSVIGHNLASPDIPLLTLYVVTNYITMKMTPATDPQQQQNQNMMAVVMSGFFFYMFLTQKWSSAFVLYWLALNLLSIWQQYVLVYKPHKERQLAAAATGGMTVPVVLPSKNGGGSASPSSGSATADKPTVRAKPRKKNRR